MQAITPELEALLKAFFETGASGFAARIEVDHVDLEADPPTIDTVSYRCDRIDIDKGLRLEADQIEVRIPRAGVAPLGWGADSVFQKNSRIRAFQWYGDPANEVRTFTGVIDLTDDARDPISVTISARDLMALLIDYTFSAFQPQTAGEPGAVRTLANGVFLNMEVSDIVGVILDAVGWPAADRVIVPTSYVVDEYIWPDGSSANEAVTGELALLVGYRAFADEGGLFHFEPALATSSLTEPPTAAYIFRPGEDLMSLADSVDQDDLRTRVKARGPLTTQVLTDEWRELWRTSKFSKPVGLWHDPADAANLRVLDRGTKRLYKLRQSDRKILSSVDISTICPHPLGLSGDPDDASVYWLLSAPWIDGGSGNNKAKKVRKSDNHVLLSLDLPDGQISALKVSADWLYFTRLDTDRFYRRNKANGAAVASYQHTVGGHLQHNPSGMMIDGTTLHLFWANGGTTARFVLCDESAPGHVTDTVKTAGTTLHGGEMDTVTHTTCYGDSDSLGLVAKFSLVAKTDRTDQVYAEVVDTELEDQLGASAQVEPRVHDTHPEDPEHRWFARRDTLDLDIVTSLAQATETAMRRLELLSRFREVLDAGIIGNPALQKTDVFGVVDPVSGLNKLYTIDAYRATMDADGVYVGTIAGITIPDLVAENGDIDDDGEGTEGDPPEIVDLNFLYGTDTDGGSSAGFEFTTHNPERANDNDIVATPLSFDDTFTFSDSGGHDGVQTIARKLKADLGTAYPSSSMTVWSENFDGGDPNLTVEYSDDGSSWSPVTGYGYVNTLVSGEINKQEITFDEVSARFWRIISSFVTGGGAGFVTDMHIWTWAIWSTAPGPIPDPVYPGVLQDAIDATPEGGTLDVTGGTFHEAVTIDHLMTLVGARLDGDATRTRWINVTAAGVTLDSVIGVNCAPGSFHDAGVEVSAAGFTAQNCNLSGGPDANMRLWPGAIGARILNCDMSDAPTEGLIGFQAHGAMVDGGRYHGNGADADDLGNEGGGIKFASTTGLTVRNVEADNNTGVGVWADGCDDVDIDVNAHDNSRAGGMLEITDGGEVTGTFNRNGTEAGGSAYTQRAGVLVSSCRDVHVSAATVAFNTSAAADISFVSQNRLDRPFPHTGNSATGNLVRSAVTGVAYYTDWGDTNVPTMAPNTAVGDADPRIASLA